MYVTHGASPEAHMSCWHARRKASILSSRFDLLLDGMGCVQGPNVWTRLAIFVEGATGVNASCKCGQQCKMKFVVSYCRVFPLPGVFWSPHFE